MPLEPRKRMRDLLSTLEQRLNDELIQEHGSLENAKRHDQRLQQSASSGLTCCGFGGVCGKGHEVCVSTNSKCCHVVCKDCAEEYAMEREEYVKTKKCPVAGCRKMMTFA